MTATQLAACAIKKRMIDTGITAAEIGRRLGVSRSAVAHVIAGRRGSARLRTGMARELGVAVDDIWPPDIVAPPERQHVDSVAPT